MQHPALRTFVRHMDRLTADETDPEVIAVRTGALLRDLLATPAAIGPEHRRPSDDGYQQHVVHVGQGGRYSLVALVWRPGQATPVHDHRCWCVVGVLQGREQEERFDLQGSDTRRWLRPAASTRYEAGDVCHLVPPDEDIHLVRNAHEDTTISLHVYGADIAALGSSINRIFDLPIDEAPGGRRSWRDEDVDREVAP